MSSAKDAGAGGTSTKTIPIATYSKHTPMEPNNLDEVRLEWSSHFKMEHGSYGDFIEPLRYYVEDMPPWDTVSAVGMNGFALEIAKRTHLDEVSAITKSNRKGKEVRSKIFAIMWKNTSSEARAQVSRVPEFPALMLAGNDPLELWKMMNRALVTTTRGDDESTQVACSVAYGQVKQDVKASLEDYLRLFKNKASRLALCGLQAPTEGQMSVHFINCLDSLRFSLYQFYVRNGMLRKPPTLQEAYDSASDFFLTRRRETRNSEKCGSEQAYGAEEGFRSEPRHKGGDDNHRKTISQDRERVSMKAAANAKGRSNPAKGAKRATTRDMSKVQCYACDKMGHVARHCPNTKDEVAAAAIEDSDDSADDEASYMCAGMELAMGANDKARLPTLTSNEIGVDSMCTAHVFGNGDLLSNVHAIPGTTFNGVGGRIKVLLRGSHPHFGEVYVSPGLPNLLSLGGLSRRRDVSIQFDQSEGCFNVAFGENMYAEMDGNRDVFVCDVDEDCKC